MTESHSAGHASLPSDPAHSPAGGSVAWMLAIPVLVLLIAGGVAFLVLRGDRLNRAAAHPHDARAAALPVLFQLPDFSLTERSGATVTRASLADKVWVANFIFTTCAGPCPRMTRRMAGLQTDLADVADLRFVTITVDPKNDTPERLREYAQQNQADSQRWLFLTGDRQAIFDLSAKGFRLGAVVDDATLTTTDHPILHSTRFALVDRQGQVRAYYDGTSPDSMEQLEQDARRLASGG